MNKKIIAAAIAGLALTGALAFGTTVSAADERPMVPPEYSQKGDAWTKNRNIREKAPVDKYFVKIYTREDAERIKPDPQIHEKLLAEMGKKPEDCFIFEDSLIGVRAAKAAGIPVAAIYDKYSDAEREGINALADMTFDSSADVLKNM